MTEPSGETRCTRVSRRIAAARQTVYRAFLEPDAVATWLPPETMVGRVHTFEPYVGGRIRMSLTYENPGHSNAGKTSADTDTFAGRFAALVPDELIVWAVEFESQDPQFAGEMRVTFHLADADVGTDVEVSCEGIPAGIRLEDNEQGSRSTLQNLAVFVE